MGTDANGSSELNAQPRRSIAELLADHAVIDAVLRRAFREAVLRHARAGNPVAVSEGGKVVWLQPEEVFARLAVENGDESPNDHLSK
jgi:hypothetical protein